MMPTPKCQHCAKPSPYATLCAKCVRTLTVGLRNVAALFADLDTVRSGAVRYVEPTGGAHGSVEPRMVVDTRFGNRWQEQPDGTSVLVRGRGSELEHDVRNTLSTWCRVVLDDHPPLRRPSLIVCTDPACQRCIPYALEVYPAAVRAWQRRQPPTDTVTSMSVYLFRMAGRIATEPYADEVLRDVLAAERKLRRFVDRPAETWYAGVCGAVLEDERPHDATSCGCQCHHGLGIACDVPGGCGLEYGTIDAVLCTRPLWADADDREVRCRDCGSTWAVDDRREIVLSEARERVLTVDAIWRIVHQLVDDQIGYTQFAARVRQWKHRGKIQPVSSRVDEGEARPAYLVADVLDLLDVTESEAS